MSLFGDLDVQSASDTLGPPDDTYAAVIEKVDVKASDSKADERGAPKVGMTLTYKITEGDHSGKKVTAYQWIPNVPAGDTKTVDEEQASTYLKILLKNLEIPESRMNNVTKEDLEGLDVAITTKQNGDYTNVNRVKLLTS